MVAQLLSIHNHLISHIKPLKQTSKMKIKLELSLPPTRKQTNTSSWLGFFFFFNDFNLVK